MRNTWIIAAVLAVATPALSAERSRVVGASPFGLNPRLVSAQAKAPTAELGGQQAQPRALSGGAVVLLEVDPTGPLGAAPAGFTAMLTVDEGTNPNRAGVRGPAGLAKLADVPLTLSQGGLTVRTPSGSTGTTRPTTEATQTGGENR